MPVSTTENPLIYPRIVVPELMDQPGIDPAEHHHALAGLRRINRFSATARQMATPILSMARAADLHRIHLMDIACGSGDVPLAVARRLKRNGIEVELLLVDKSPTALDEATEAARFQNISCRTIASDAIDGNLLDGPDAKGSLQAPDVVTCSLFLHHVPTAAQVVALLSHMASMADRMVVVSDLVRTRAGYVGAWLGCRLLSRSPVVHYDGPASVNAAWTISELREFAAAAGIAAARVEASFPNRMLLTWRRESSRSKVAGENFGVRDVL